MNQNDFRQDAAKLLASSHALVIGHRGYSAVAPENTLPAFQLALEAGSDFVELDYRHSGDGVPMVIHDATLNRTTDAGRKWKRRRIAVSTRSAAELQTLDAGTWFRRKFAGTKVPLLSDALDFICGSGGVAVIEHKAGDPETLARILRNGNWLEQVVVISFDWQFLKNFHALESAAVLGALGPPERLSSGPKPGRRGISLARRLGELVKTGAALAVWNQRVSERDVQSAHARGLKVWIYTVNRPRQALRLLERGADGIITNEISLIRQVIG